MADDIKELLGKAAQLKSSQFDSGSDLILVLLLAFLESLGFRSPGDGASPRLPDAWKSGDEAYAFKLRHPQSSFTFLIKGLVLGKQLVVHGLAEEVRVSAVNEASGLTPNIFPKKDGKLHSLDIALDSVIQSGTRWPMEDVTAGSLLTAFVSEETLRELLYQFKIKIVQKLIPGLNKPGYEVAK
jgi:proteasome inhibitor subunit 1 (PI31)